MSHSNPFGEIKFAIIYTGNNFIAFPIDYSPFTIKAHRCQTIIKPRNIIIYAWHDYLGFFINKSIFAIQFNRSIPIVKIKYIIVHTRSHLIAGKVNQSPFFRFSTKYLHERIMPIIIDSYIFTGKFQPFFH